LTEQVQNSIAHEAKEIKEISQASRIAPVKETERSRLGYLPSTTTGPDKRKEARVASRVNNIPPDLSIWS
jgi:hypothetical protein